MLTKRSIPPENQEALFDELCDEGYDFFTGVPDSSLKAFLKRLEARGDDVEHVRAVWEAEAVGIAVGAQLANKKACVYMQNSGLCFALNPLTSLCIPYGMRPLLVVGHRHTLPQHRVMGEIDSQLLEAIGWNEYVMVGS